MQYGLPVRRPSWRAADAGPTNRLLVSLAVPQRLRLRALHGIPYSSQLRVQPAHRASAAYAASQRSGITEDASRAWRPKDGLTPTDDGTGVGQRSSTSARLQDSNHPHQQTDVPGQAAREQAAGNFPAEQWSQQQQSKQQYRQQQWQLWNARQQQLERREQLQSWQKAQQGQRQQQAADGEQAGQLPYAYDQTRWKVRSNEWRQGPPPRYPHGTLGPSYILDTSPGQHNTPDHSNGSSSTVNKVALSSGGTFSDCSDATSGCNMTGTPSIGDAVGVDAIQLGEALDKHMCFYGSCSLAVMQPQHDADVALAAVSTAMREMHRCSGSSLMFQVQPLKPCPAIPQPPVGSLLLVLHRVLRPIPLPVPHQQILLADVGGDAAVVADAAVKQLLFGKGCAPVLTKSGSGVGVALAAVQRARNTLQKLYKRDCVVYLMWKTARQSPASTPDTAAAAESRPGQSSIGQQSPDTAMSSTCVGFKVQQQQQQLTHQAGSVDTDRGSTASEVSVDTAAAVTAAAGHQRQHQQQQQQQHWRHERRQPPRLYKLLLIACDAGDFISGWVDPDAYQLQEWKKPVGLPLERWEKQQQWRYRQRQQQQQQRRRQQHSRDSSVAQKGSSSKSSDGAGSDSSKFSREQHSSSRRHTNSSSKSHEPDSG